ncbi:hypothetical protein CGRA01v4_09584 [Colletotrichum graminicola]|nr:hypothetical protein CGRA01v4_09584 [Colletotrichum graminicola]
MLCFKSTPHVRGHSLEHRGRLSTPFYLMFRFFPSSTGGRATCAVNPPRQPTRRWPRSESMYPQPCTSSEVMR